jgi:hypothetical protein
MEERIDIDRQRMNLLKGIIKPKKEFKKFAEAKKITGFGWRLVLLAILNAIIGAATAYVSYRLFGIPEETLQQLQNAGLEMTKEMIVIGNAILFGIVGLFLTLAIPTIAALIYWIFFTAVGFKKLFIINMYVLVITLVASAVQLALLAVFKFEPTTYLSLGSFTRLLTDNAFLNAFFGGITIFLFWKVYILVTALQKVSIKSNSYVVFVFIMLNVLLLLFNASAALFDPDMLMQIKELKTTHP